MKSLFYGILCVLPLVSAAHGQDTKAAAAPTKTVDGSAVVLPKPATDLQPGTYHCAVKLAMGGRTVDLKITTAITDGGPSWTALNTMETPQGSAADSASIAKSTQTLEKRSLKQGPIDIKICFAGNKASGKMSMSGQDQAIAVDLGGPIFANAAGGNQVIATLPLAMGYTRTFRNFDVQTQKLKMMQLTVPSVETVTVPAGTFEAWRVELAATDGSADKKTLCVAKDSRKVVKGAAVIAATGGASFDQQLTE